ncbi:MAG: hypothetical protein G01um101448_817 [Parcubacteria group bacterium Gr01-1014_48]|nr:MAG: hypothetical protein Greene041614_997 [Parcubacteria group bacterium Greene0416_14]TSC73324.1 MAG: hypothetical protein G01um101448_817 [Parcubacteria group bacterium Gr01-1014_48]TSC99951.1 MAG: hypothetical protein Greene101415_1021 [Parcubacteria group bacterium Greene1014_15]TSD07411.1 MAG: hypothetical protein Greene07144_903 [Parcubacteria group bacterium Greene0714_4]
MRTEQRKQSYITIIALFIIALMMGLWSSGALTRHSGPKNASIEITVSDIGSRVFLDNKRKNTTTKENEVVIFKHLESRVYTVLVASEGHYPWYKAVDLTKNQEVEFTPFSVATNLTNMTVPSTDPKFQSIKTVIHKDILPTKTGKRRSANGNVDIWTELSSNSIHAEWVGNAVSLPNFFCPLGACTNHIIIFSGKTPIRSLDFYKNRDDAVILAIENSISVLELDISPPQNFQPIFTGDSPKFHQPESGILFIQSGQAISVVRY